MAGVDETNPLNASLLSAFPTNERSSRAAIQALFDGLTGTGDMIGSNNLSDVDSASTSFTNIKQAATTSATGVAELATGAETVTGTSTTKVVTPDGLTDRMAAPGEIGGTTRNHVNSIQLEALTTTTGTAPIIARNSNGGFNNNIFFGWTVRSNSSAFNLLKLATNTAADTEFLLRGDGNAFADGTWSGGGADYAEWREWEDGNPDKEDRRGLAVSMVGRKIQEAKSGEQIIGVISGKPSVVGNAEEFHWHKKFLKDVYGEYVLTENGERKINPEFDPEKIYISRKLRKEWGCVGLVGELPIRKGQQVDSRWIEMDTISEELKQWHIR